MLFVGKNFSTSKKGEENHPPLKKHLLDGDFFIGASLATSMTKLALRYCEVINDPKKQNRFIAEAMLIITSIINLGRSGILQKDEVIW